METEFQRSVNHGGSLRVENVQALASKNLTEIPPRYLRPEAELVPVFADDSVHIPVIDMGKLHDDQHPFIKQGEMERLHSACTEWGFFQVHDQSLNLTYNNNIMVNNGYWLFDLWYIMYVIEKCYTF